MRKEVNLEIFDLIVHYRNLIPLVQSHNWNRPISCYCAENVSSAISHMEKHIYSLDLNDGLELIQNLRRAMNLVNNHDINARFIIDRFHNNVLSCLEEKLISIYEGCEGQEKNKLIELATEFSFSDFAELLKRETQLVDPSQAALSAAQEKLQAAEEQNKALELALEAEKKAAIIAEQNLILMQKLTPIKLKRIAVEIEAAKILQQQFEAETELTIAETARLSARFKAEIAQFQEEKTYKEAAKMLQAEKDNHAKEAHAAEAFQNYLLLQLKDNIQKLESDINSYNILTRFVARASEDVKLAKLRINQAAINAIETINDPNSNASLLFEIALNDPKNLGWNDGSTSDLIAQVKKCLAKGITTENNLVVGIVVSEESKVVQLPPAARSTPLPVIVERMEEPRPPVVARPASPRIGSTAFFSLNMPVVPAHPLPEVDQSTSVKKECASA